MVAAPENLRVQYIPDDGFYYLTLARNFSTLRLWTFDSGVSLTSGFHLTFAYLLAGIFSLFNPDTSGFVSYSIIFGTLISIGAITTLWYWGFREKNVVYIMLLGLVISSRNFVINTVSLTEWTITLLIASLYCVWFFTRHRYPTIKVNAFVLLFLLGLLGSVTRTDFGLLPLSIAGGTIVFYLLNMSSRRQLLFACTGLIGTITGVFLVFAHNYIFTQEILQSSAKIKAFWAMFDEPNYFTTPLLIREIVGFMGLVALAILILAAVLPVFLKRGDGRTTRKSQAAFSNQESYELLLMVISTVVCILGYTFFYSSNGAVQVWYTSNLILPILMLIMVISRYLMFALHEKVRVFLLPIFFGLMIINVSSLFPITTQDAPWPHQKIMHNAGVYLNKNYLDAKVASWNAGIIGYYEGGHVINLDGLVNNNIYHYVVNNNLPEYLLQENILYIVDFESMIITEARRVRGGFNDPNFIATLIPQKVFEEGDDAGRHLTLYRIDRGN